MKNLMFSLVCLALIQPLWAQKEQVVDSKISRVTVFLNQAQVNREIKTRVEAGKTDLVISGLTANLDQRSVQVSGKGSIVILGINHRQNFISEFNMPTNLKKLKDSLTVYQNWINVEQNQKDILNKEEQMLTSNQVIGGKNTNLTVAELKGMSEFYRSRLTDISMAKMKADDNMRKYKERMSVLQKQFNELNDLYKRNTSEIVVSVSANAASNVELDMNYLVNNAGWTPVYDLRAINTNSPMQLNYKANVYQNTGEEWNNVRLKLSTGNPTLGGVKPELYTWFIDFEQVVAYYNERQLKLAPMTARLVQPEMAADALEEVSSTAQFVNPLQTTLNTEFEISLPYNVSSSR
ncbi:MAG TPA: mucoidy inhibitor MuiA family protein, partial [Cyclobacteriaceae bacterium]|nr:mucoidy inhibitor MuiA family protein [Cyclobacteriaceae bacterium]